MSFELAQIGLVHANGQRALRAVSLAAGRGERLAIIGPSGAGKSSLLHEPHACSVIAAMLVLVVVVVVDAVSAWVRRGQMRASG